MACPYCGSGDWGYEMDGDGSPELIGSLGQYITIRRRCGCRDCGRLFYTDEAYRSVDWYDSHRTEDVDGDGKEDGG